MTIHFVYAVPQAGRIRGLGRALAGYGALARRLRRPPPYRDGWLPGLADPLAAPYSITVNLLRALRREARCKLYDWREAGGIEYGPDDIVLGHPHPDPDTPIQRAFASDRPCRAKVLLFPIHHALPAVNAYALPLLDRADRVLGIMGPYWYDTLAQSVFAPWRHKITRLDMAVDAAQYPWVKRRFNPPGRRGYLHIGYNVPEKGPQVLAAAMAGLTEFRRGWIGAGEEIPHIPRLTPFAALTPAYVAGLASDYDVFVNTSVSDANPTTILEAMAWGFAVACTPQSGYYAMPTLSALSVDDARTNIAVLRGLQFAPSETLAEAAAANRRLVETHYTWERFCGTVRQTLAPFLPEAGT